MGGVSETEADKALSEDDTPLSQQDDLSLAAAVRRDVDKADKRQQAWRREAQQAFDYVAGDQWSDEDKAVLRAQGRPPVTFNRLGVLIDAICGSQINNRQEMKFLPRTINDQGSADIIQGVVNWARDQADAEDEESEAFRDLAICGMGWAVNRVDYTDDPQGRILKDRVSPLEMRWDPAAKKKNLSDARWKAHIKLLPEDEVEAMWPGATVGMSTSFRKGPGDATVVLPTRDRYEDHEDGNLGDDGTVEVIEYQWRESEALWAVSDGGRAVYLDKARFEALREAREGKEMPRFVRLARSRWYRAIVCGDNVLERGECPDPEDSTYQCMTGKRDEGAGMWYGLVRGLIDPQQWANKWLSQSIHILNTSAKSGLLVEEGAVTEPRKFEEEYAKAGSVNYVAPGSLSGGRILPKTAPGMPVGFDRLLQFAIMSIPDISGVNREVLGLADREQAGILEAQRKQAAQAVLAPLFDALRLYYKRDGRQIARMVAAYIPADKQIRIIGEDTQEPRLVSTAMLPDVREYDIVVDEAPTSPNQKSEVWQFMAPTLPALMKAGIPPGVWVELLKFSPLPDSAVTHIKELLQQQEQQQQQQAQQPSPEMAKIEAQAQADQQRLAFEAQKSQQEMAMEERRFELEQQKAAFQLQHEQQRLEFERVKAAQDMALQREKASQDADLRARAY